MNLKVLYTKDSYIKMSMFGNEYGSLGHIRFRLVKSTHIRHFWIDFWTNTTFGNHVEYLIS